MKGVMSKALIVVMIMLTLVTTSCERKNTDNIETGTKAPEISDKESSDTESQTQTENSNDTETEQNEVDIEDEMCLPFKLLDMTFEEIQAVYGKMERLVIKYGGSPGYVAEKLPQFLILFTSDGLPEFNIEKDSKPNQISVLCAGDYLIPGAEPPYEMPVPGTVIYPGIEIGMTVEEVKNIIADYQIKNLINPHAESVAFFETSIYVGKYRVAIGWDIPKEYINETFEILETYKEDERNEKLNELADRIWSDDRIYVNRIYV